MNENPYIKYKNIYVIPTFHSRIEFAKLVRTALFKVVKKSEDSDK